MCKYTQNYNFCNIKNYPNQNTLFTGNICLFSTLFTRKDKKAQKTGVCTKSAQSHQQHRTHRQQPIRLRIRRLRVRILLGAPEFTADFCGFSLLLLWQPVFVFYAFFCQKQVVLWLFYTKSAQNLHKTNPAFLRV